MPVLPDAFERRACFTQSRLVLFEPARTGMRVGNHSRQWLPDLMRDGGNHRAHGGEPRNAGNFRLPHDFPLARNRNSPQQLHRKMPRVGLA
jgi:hypothetical protein